MIPIPNFHKSKNPEDHRPVHMLPLYKNVMETTVKEQLMAFIDRTGVLLNEQSGFRKHHGRRGSSVSKKEELLYQSS